MARGWTRILLICADKAFGADVDVDAHVDVIGFLISLRLGRSVLLTRKPFAAGTEFFFADFFALFASWRLMRDSIFTAKTRRTQRKR